MKREKPYVVSQDIKSGAWYCHRRGFSYCPVFGSIGTKKKAQSVCNLYNSHFIGVKPDGRIESSMRSVEELTELNLKVAGFYGYEAQSNQLVEECAELIQAVNKYRRARGLGQATPVELMAAKDNLIEEIADVEVMLDQIKYLLKVHELDIQAVKDKKMSRTLERMYK